MKKKIFACVLFVSLILFIFYRMDKPTKVKLYSDKECDLGEIVHRTEERQWLMQNIGWWTLHIDSIKTSCECLQLTCDECMDVEPGHYFLIKATLLPDTTVIGGFMREIEVYGNILDSPLVLSFRGVYKKKE